MQDRRPPDHAAPGLLNARQVQDLLQVDRSTVYRMAEDGRLPSIKVGKQWRFPADRILALLPQQHPDALGRTPPGTPSDDAVPRQAAALPRPPDPKVAQAAIDVAAPLLGVMMVVTDIEGAPVTDISNPCPWFVAHADDPHVIESCLAEWRDLAGLADLQPRFQPSSAGFECARAFIRSGSSLVGMVLAGGVNPAGAAAEGRYELDPAEREHVLAALPRIAASLTRPAPTPLGAQKETR